MTKRAAALLIALFVAAAPSAVEACQISCASMSMPAHGVEAVHHGDGQTQPSCHETAPGGHALSPASPPCDHDGALISSLLVTTRPDVVASAPVPIVTSGYTNPAPAAFVDRGPIVPAVNRLELRLSSPLRI